MSKIGRHFTKGIAYMMTSVMALSVFSTTGSISVVKAADEESAQLPSYYNLNDYGYVTSVKDQMNFGLCWGFASIAAAETSILSELGLTVDEYREIYGTDFDLSELQLGWFVNTVIPTDEESQAAYDNQGGEGLYYVGDDESINARINASGNTINASSLFAAANGPVFETDVPYKGKNGIITYKVTYADGTVERITDLDKIDNWDDVVSNEPLYYSADDDWSVDEKYRQGCVALLEESYLISATSEEDDNGEYIYREDLVEQAKKLILDGKALAISYYAVTSTVDELSAESAYYNKETAAHYTDEYIKANHGVTIVGYDDNYSKDNFTITPPGDGAWIVKNNWGSIYNEFPTDYGYEGSGYFYLSYYDRSIVHMEAFDFDVSYWNTSQEKFMIAQYDYMPGLMNVMYYSGDDLYSANVFSSGETAGILNDIAISTAMDNTDITANIYILNDNYKDPTDGTLVGTLNKFVEYAGYHKIPLSEKIYIPKGVMCSVVVTQKSIDEDVLYIGAKYYFNENAAKLYGLDSAANAVVNPGESYVYIDGMWYDWSDARYVVFATVASDSEGIVEVDNFPIKMYLSVVTGPAGDNLEYEIDADGNLSITGKGDMYDYTLISLAPWYHEKDVIKSITIGKGVTHIGDYAFYGLDLADTVTFEGDIPSVGANSFVKSDGTEITYKD